MPNAPEAGIRQPLFTPSIRFLVAALIFLVATIAIPFLALIAMILTNLGYGAHPTVTDTSPSLITARVSATAAALGIAIATASLRGRRGWFVASCALLAIAVAVALLFWDVAAS